MEQLTMGKDAHVSAERDAKCEANCGKSLEYVIVLDAQARGNDKDG